MEFSPLFIIATILCLIVSLIASETARKRLKELQRPKASQSPLTFRISNIPTDTTNSRFRSIVRSALEHSSSSSIAFPHPALLGWSLSRSGQSLVGTVTLSSSEDPYQLRLAIEHSMGLESSGLRVDLDFFGLTLLADPENATVDIVAVTGLAGHAFGSWRSQDGSCMWLRDFLPTSIPNARIITYGYDTKLPGSQSTATILELSKKLLESVKVIRNNAIDRPIIFIGHSLGGLVVKQALVDAYKGPKDQAIVRSCYAVILFGVPNKGIDVASLRTIVKGQPNEDLILNLKPSSLSLQLLHKMFCERFVEDSQIICAYETRKTPTVEWSPRTNSWERSGQKVLMVPHASATLDGRNENSVNHIPIDADHSSMVKFSHRSDDHYVIIEERIRILVDQAPRVIAERTNAYRKKTSKAAKEYIRTLNAPNYSAFRHTRVEDPVDGTCRWILREELLKKWISQLQTSVLWIRGTPGQGKTVMTKFLLSHLEELATKVGKADFNKTLILYFFFYDQDERLRTVESLLRSLIEQILKATDISESSADVFSDHLFPESEDDLWEILYNAFKSLARSKVSTTIYCMVDALDECVGEAPRTMLLRRFKKLLVTLFQGKEGTSVLKLLVTSRPIVDIARELKQTPCIDLKVNSDDLKMFIEIKVESIGISTPQLQSYAMKLLLDRAGGTFLWVAIILRQLEMITLPSSDKIKKIVERSPIDLEEFYSNIINEIMQGPEEDQKLLAWVVYAKRPLSLRELEEALAIQEDSRSQMSTAPYRAKVDRTEALGSTVGVILEITDDEVHLFHQSAKDLLVKTGQLSTSEFYHGLHPNIYLSKVCLTYLAFKDFDSGLCSSIALLEDRKHQFPLFFYAARYWHVHIRSNDDINELSPWINRIIKPGSSTFLSWAQASGIHDLHTATETWDIAAKANINWLAEFESSTTIVTKERALQAVRDEATGYNIMERFAKRDDIEFHEDAILIIARNWGEGIMRLLLTRSDFTVSDALLKAVISNTKYAGPVVRLLLEQSCITTLTVHMVKAAAKNKVHCNHLMEMLLLDDNVEITDSAVLAMVRYHKAEVVRHLPERFKIKITREVLNAAHYNQQNEGGKCIELFLSRQPDFVSPDQVVGLIARDFGPRAMKLLLDCCGENVTITNNVVKMAAENSIGGEAIMELLLDRRGNEVHITEDIAKAAAGNTIGGEAIMELLLDQRGEEVHITEEVLKAAAESTYGHTLKLLLNRREEEVHITEAIVKAAAGSNAIHNLELLLDRRGEEVHVTEEVLKTAVGSNTTNNLTLLLHRRGEEVHVTEEVLKEVAGNRWNGSLILELLLDHQRDKAKITEEVLKEAAGNYSEGFRMLQLLLGSQTNDVQITRDVLRAAATSGQEQIFQFLDKQYSGSIDRQNLISTYQLFHSCRTFNTTLFTELLAAGADPDIRDIYNRSPLWWYVWFRSERGVRLLLSEGKVDPNVQCSRTGSTPLIIAMINGHDKLVELLLQAGSDKNIADKHGRTAMSMEHDRFNPFYSRSKMITDYRLQGQFLPDNGNDSSAWEI